MDSAIIKEKQQQKYPKNIGTFFYMVNFISTREEQLEKKH